MSRLEFRIDRVNRSNFDRARDQLRQPDASPGARAGRWLRGSPGGLVVVSVALVAGAVAVLTPVVLIDDVPVRARRVLVFADAPLQAAADAQSAKLAAAGISVERAAPINRRRTAGGFVGAINGITELISGSSLPNSVSQELPTHPGVDAVFVVSAFAEADDPAQLAQFQDLVRRNGVRLYLNAVNNPPSPGLLALARESGGALISPARK